MPINAETITVEEVAIEGIFGNYPNQTPYIVAKVAKVNSVTGEVLKQTRRIRIDYNPQETFKLPDDTIVTHEHFYEMFKALVVNEMQKSQEQ